MTTLEAILLGIVQGITEFLPVSSSGHLQFFQTLLGIKNLDNYILFDLVCHMGTLLAILIIFRKEILESFTRNTLYLKQISLAILPLFPLLLVMKPIKKTYEDPYYLGFFFLATAALLFIGVKLGKDRTSQSLQKTRWRDAFAVGTVQALAIFPGVSRSGSTISAARMMGWSREKAVTFSFLLAIPTILGGTMLEVLKLSTGTVSVAEVGLSQYVIGFLFSFIVGYGSLNLLKRIVLRDGLMVFVWYCLGIGFLSIYLFTI